MKKVVLLLMSMILVLSLAACGGGASNAGGGGASNAGGGGASNAGGGGASNAGGGGASNAGGGGGAAAAEEEVRVALLLSGPITDMGWSASGYAGLMAVEAELGLDVAYKDEIASADMESDFRYYASNGYNVLIGMGSQFTDAILAVNEDFPDHKFIIVNGSVSADNVRSVQLSDEDAGYMAGCVAVLMTESNVIGMVGGQELPPIVRGTNGFKQGAAETMARIGKDVEVITTMTGDFNDVAKAKEFTISLYNQGADIVYGLANQAGRGIIEAAVEMDQLVIGSSTDQSSAAPDNVLQSMVRDTSKAYVLFMQEILDGKFKGDVIKYGVAEDVIILAPWHNFEDKVPQEVKDILEEIKQDIKAGKVVITGQ